MTHSATTPAAGGEEPSVESFAINPMGEPDIIVDGHRRFVGESDFVAYRAWAKRAIAALSAPSPAVGATGVVPEGEDLDARLKAAGMFTVSEMMGETPLSRFMVHTGVRDLASFEQWLDRRVAEFLRLRVAYELGDKPKDDELYEWTLAHCAAMSSVREHFKTALAAAPEAPTPATSAPGAEGPANWTLSNKARKEIAEIDRATVMSPSLSGFAPYTPITVRSGTSAPGAEGGEDLAGLSARADAVVQRVAEWDDRTSPEEWPEAMLITGEELHKELVEFALETARLTPAAPTPAPVAQGEPVAWLWEYADSSGTWHEIASVEKPNPGGRRNIRPLGLISGAGSLPAKQGEPSAWAYEELKTRTFDTWEPALSYGQPEPASYHRNIRPLYAAPAAPRSADLPGREEIARVVADELGFFYDPADVEEAEEGDPKPEDYLRAADAILKLLTPPSPTQEMRAAGGDEDEQAAHRIVSARLAADTDGYGSVDITLRGGRRVLLALDAPHWPAAGGEDRGGE